MMCWKKEGEKKVRKCLCSVCLPLTTVFCLACLIWPDSNLCPLEHSTQRCMNGSCARPSSTLIDGCHVCVSCRLCVSARLLHGVGHGHDVWQLLCEMSDLGPHLCVCVCVCVLDWSHGSFMWKYGKSETELTASVLKKDPKHTRD